MRGKNFINKKNIFVSIVAAITVAVSLFSTTSLFKTSVETTEDKAVATSFTNADMIKSALRISAYGRKDSRWYI